MRYEFEIHVAPMFPPQAPVEFLNRRGADGWSIVTCLPTVASVSALQPEKTIPALYVILTRKVLELNACG